MKPKCTCCNGAALIIIQQYDSASLIGIQTFAVPCPICRPKRQPQPVFDGKLAAAGDTQ